MRDETDAVDLTVREQIYTTILERSTPPTSAEVAAKLGIDEEIARAAYERLHARHLIFLTPGTHDVRMLHPFSGVPTAFRVFANDRAYWANCAWDALGIPAALHANARIAAETGDNGEPVDLTIERGRVAGWQGIVHVALPLRRWYDDLIHT